MFSPIVRLALKALRVLSLEAVAAIWLRSSLSRVGDYEEGQEIKGLRVLALNPERFRGELEALVATGRVEILQLPFDVTARLRGAFLGHGRDLLAVCAGRPKNDTEKELLRHFDEIVGPIWRIFLRRARIDVVLSAALHYHNDLAVGRLSENAGVPYVVCHRECLHAAEHVRRVNRARWSPVGRVRLSHLIVHNETARDTFVRAGAVAESAVSILGNPRMDRFARLLSEKTSRGSQGRRRRVLFFSFCHGNSMAGTVPIWSDGSTKGYVRLFVESHGAFGWLAKRNPDVEFVIKTKWSRRWCEEIASALWSVGVNVAELENLRMTDEGDPQELILGSDVVCSFGSTTMLEAGVAGKPVIVPLFAEAADPAYGDCVLLKDTVHCFDVATSAAEFCGLIEKRLENPDVSATVRDHRRRAFEYWISPLDGGVADRWVDCLEAVVTGWKGVRDGEMGRKATNAALP